MDKIKVALVEEDTNWIKLMMTYLNNKQNIYVVATACNKEDAIQLPERYSLDAILMDISLSSNNLDGISATVEILKHHKVKIIMFTLFEDNQLILDSFKAGAVDYILKCQYEEIPNAIRKAVQPRNPHEILVQEFIRINYKNLLKSLTKAEQEVFYFIEKGSSITNIANSLYKTESTIKKQINSIYKKLNISSRKEVLEKVKNGGLINNSSLKKTK